MLQRYFDDGTSGGGRYLVGDTAALGTAYEVLVLKHEHGGIEGDFGVGGGHADGYGGSSNNSQQRKVLWVSRGGLPIWCDAFDR